MADGAITIKTDLDNSDLEKQLKEAEHTISSLKKKLENQELEQSFLEKMMDRANKSIEQTNQRIDELKENAATLKTERAGLDRSTPEGAARYHEISEELSKIHTQMMTAYADNEKQYAAIDKYDEAWHKAYARASSYEERIAEVSQRQERLKGEIAQMGAKAVESYGKASEGTAKLSTRIQGTFSSIAEGIRQKMGEAANRSVQPWQNFSKRVNALLRRVFVFGVILKGLNAIKNAIGSMLSGNSQLTASVENLKAVLRGFLSQVVSGLVPILSQAASVLAGAFERIAQIIDSIFGTNIVASIAQQRAEASAAIQQANAEKIAEYNEQVAQQQNAEARAAERQARAARKLEEAQKKANQQIMGFDELNKLAEESVEDLTDETEDAADGGGVIPFPELQEDWTQALSPASGALQGIFDWLDEIKDRILNDVEGPFARIREGLELIKQGWDELLQGFATGDLGLIWKGIGDIIIGTLYAIEGAFDALMDWLDEQTGGRFTEIFEGLKQVVHGFVEFVEGILRGDFELAFQGVCDMVEGTGKTIKGIISGIIDFAHDAVDKLIDELEKKMPHFTGIFENIREFAHNVLDSIEKFLRKSVDSDVSVVKGALNTIIGIFTLDLDRILKGIKQVADGIKGHVNALKTFLSEMVSNVASFLRNGINGVFDFLIQKFPQARAAIEAFRQFVLGVGDMIYSTIRGILDGIGAFLEHTVEGARLIISGGFEVIAGIFTLNGERIIQGLKDIVNGFISILEGVLDGVLYGVLGFADGIIDGLNRIPGVDIPSISFQGVNLPRLAQGAVIPPNREFMAILGDQTRGNNIETPESLMRQVVREETGPLLADVVAALLTANMGGRTNDGRDLVLMVDRKELARETLRGIGDLMDTGELGAASGLVFQG